MTDEYFAMRDNDDDNIFNDAVIFKISDIRVIRIGKCLLSDADDFLKEFNKLSNENHELREFKDNVFDKINEDIETSDKYRTPIETLKYGEDIGYWNGVYQRMKRLKRELKE